MPSLPKFWINRTGDKIAISQMSDLYVNNAIEKLQEDVANTSVPRPIQTYALMFNKGQKWSVRTFKKWSATRLKALLKEQAQRGILPVGPAQAQVAIPTPTIHSQKNPNELSS